MSAVELAYAVTVHKSQGSEYPVVIIPLESRHKGRLYRRNLLYTAVTRAQKKVVIVGDREAIAYCVRNPDSDVRNTLLADRIHKAAGKVRNTGHS